MADTGVRTFISDLVDDFAPRKDDPDGPLAPMLLLLTFVTGVVDAFSYLLLGHVLVANMTGNVVFLGFSIGGAEGFIWWACVLALGAFLAGAFLGGRFIRRWGHHRGQQLAWSTAVETSLVILTVLAVAWVPLPYEGWEIVAPIVLLGIALGLQNATARSLGVTDLTTTVLTLTITGVAADAHAASGKSSKLGRRIVPIVIMLLGGLAGALLVAAQQPTLVLLLAIIVLAIVTAMATRTASSTAEWTKPKGKK